ncbi:MAG: hypothetical protein KBC84_07025 [Proteobacteria bacterium]|nr:hypothetical protein [Pseudomonadota bacterium]
MSNLKENIRPENAKQLELPASQDNSFHERLNTVVALANCNVLKLKEFSEDILKTTEIRFKYFKQYLNNEISFSDAYEKGIVDAGDYINSNREYYLQKYNVSYFGSKEEFSTQADWAIVLKTLPLGELSDLTFGTTFGVIDLIAKEEAGRAAIAIYNNSLDSINSICATDEQWKNYLQDAKIDTLAERQNFLAWWGAGVDVLEVLTATLFVMASGGASSSTIAAKLCNKASILRGTKFLGYTATTASASAYAQELLNPEEDSMANFGKSMLTNMARNAAFMGLVSSVSSWFAKSHLQTLETVLPKIGSGKELAALKIFDPKTFLELKKAEAGMKRISHITNLVGTLDDWGDIQEGSLQFDKINYSDSAQVKGAMINLGVALLGLREGKDSGADAHLNVNKLNEINSAKAVLPTTRDTIFFSDSSTPESQTAHFHLDNPLSQIVPLISEKQTIPAESKQRLVEYFLSLHSSESPDATTLTEKFCTFTEECLGAGNIKLLSDVFSLIDKELSGSADKTLATETKRQCGQSIAEVAIRKITTLETAAIIELRQFLVETGIATKESSNFALYQRTNTATTFTMTPSMNNLGERLRAVQQACFPSHIQVEPIELFAQFALPRLTEYGHGDLCFVQQKGKNILGYCIVVPIIDLDRYIFTRNVPIEDVKVINFADIAVLPEHRQRVAAKLYKAAIDAILKKYYSREVAAPADEFPVIRASLLRDTSYRNLDKFLAMINYAAIYYGIEFTQENVAPESADETFIRVIFKPKKLSSTGDNTLVLIDREIDERKSNLQIDRVTGLSHDFMNVLLTIPNLFEIRKSKKRPTLTLSDRVQFARDILISSHTAPLPTYYNSVSLDAALFPAASKVAAVDKLINAINQIATATSSETTDIDVVKSWNQIIAHIEQIEEIIRGSSHFSREFLFTEEELRAITQE